MQILQFWEFGNGEYRIEQWFKCVYQPHHTILALVVAVALGYCNNEIVIFFLNLV